MEIGLVPELRSSTQVPQTLAVDRTTIQTGGTMNPFGLNPVSSTSIQIILFISTKGSSAHMSRREKDEWPR
jgi:hypothetical protein